MIERIKVWLWSWFAPDKYVAYIAREATRDVACARGGEADGQK